MKSQTRCMLQTWFFNYCCFYDCKHIHCILLNRLQAGRTPIMLAKEFHYEDVVELFEDAEEEVRVTKRTCLQRLAG